MKRNEKKALSSFLRLKPQAASMALIRSPSRSRRGYAPIGKYITFVQKLLGICQPHRAAQLGVGKEPKVRAGDKDRVLLIDFF